MESLPISRMTAELFASHRPLIEFMGRYEQGTAGRSIADFVAGNPQEMALPQLVAALVKWTAPRTKDHFAYQMNVPEARATVVASLRGRRGIAIDPEDVFLTNGAFAGLAVTMRTICDPGDEVIYLSPPWFFYRALISATGCVPVRVDVDPASFDIDVDAVARAITPRTRAVIVNSPNNPTGRIYPRATLDALAAALESASRRGRRRIYLISDEAYSRILFDGRSFESPTESYAYSFLVYTYGKQLLAPGERIGYIALPPAMPASDREALRGAITMAQLVTGWAYPNAVPQYALGDIEDLVIDLAHLQRKRDRMVSALQAMGYLLHSPEATFYLLPRCPWADDGPFVEHLAKQDVWVLPGALVERPGTFRISLTASDAMIERALPVLASAVRERAPA